MSRRTDYQPEYRRYLPHIQPPGATPFVTFRLAGSLPAAVVQQLWQEQRLRQLEIGAMAVPDSVKQSLMYDEEKRGFGRFDVLLDRGDIGPQWLKEPPIASMVCDKLHDMDGQFFDLLAYCVMPNHVHLVMTPLP